MIRKAPFVRSRKSLLPRPYAVARRDYRVVRVPAGSSDAELIRRSASRLGEALEQLRNESALDQQRALSITEIALSTYRLLDPRRRIRWTERVNLCYPIDRDDRTPSVPGLGLPHNGKPLRLLAARATMDQSSQELPATLSKMVDTSIGVSEIDQAREVVERLKDFDREDKKAIRDERLKWIRTWIGIVAIAFFSSSSVLSLKGTATPSVANTDSDHESPGRQLVKYQPVGSERSLASKEDARTNIAMGKEWHNPSDDGLSDDSSSDRPFAQSESGIDEHHGTSIHTVAELERWSQLSSKNMVSFIDHFSFKAASPPEALNKASTSEVRPESVLNARKVAHRLFKEQLDTISKSSGEQRVLAADALAKELDVLIEQSPKKSADRLALMELQARSSMLAGNFDSQDSFWDQVDSQFGKRLRIQLQDSVLGSVDSTIGSASSSVGSSVVQLSLAIQAFMVMSDAVSYGFEREAQELHALIYAISPSVSLNPRLSLVTDLVSALELNPERAQELSAYAGCLHDELCERADCSQTPSDSRIQG